MPVENGDVKKTNPEGIECGFVMLVSLQLIEKHISELNTSP